jgi:hypothetical protein
MGVCDVGVGHGVGKGVDLGVGDLGVPTLVGTYLMRPFQTRGANVLPNAGSAFPMPSKNSRLLSEAYWRPRVRPSV